jgi:transposase
MSHPNSRHTALGRWQFVRLVVGEGFTFEQAAAHSRVSRSTVWKWVRRWQAASEADRVSLVCLDDRSSRPLHSPRRVPEHEERRICELRARTGWGPRLLAVQAGRSHPTVHRVLQRAGCSRRPAAEREAIVRYEWPCPGQLLHMDVKKFARFTEPGHKTTGDRTRRSRRPG